jgi:hypothetical protein
MLYVLNIVKMYTRIQVSSSCFGIKIFERHSGNTRTICYNECFLQNLVMWSTFVLALCIHLTAAEVCPGGRKTCSQKMTCCELSSGEQGCCPYDDAKCCADKVHCCPHGKVPL